MPATFHKEKLNHCISVRFFFFFGVTSKSPRKENLRGTFGCNLTEFPPHTVVHGVQNVGVHERSGN